MFASRSPFRPNPLGLSCVELIEVKDDEENGDVLIVGGADLLDNTPIYDIKPYLAYSDSKPNARSGYAEDEVNHRLTVEMPESIAAEIPENKLEALIECLADDPRPSYQDDRDRVYTMSFADYDISFKVNGLVLTVVKVQGL